MKSIIILFSFLICSDLFSYNSFGFNAGPVFGVSGIKTSGIMFDADWNPHENIGTRLLMSIDNSIWVGTALSFIYQTPENFSKYYDWRATFSIPFMLRINANLSYALAGFSIGNSFSFNIDNNKKYSFVIKPLEMLVMPMVFYLYPAHGIEKRANIFFSASAGLRMKI